MKRLLLTLLLILVFASLVFAVNAWLQERRHFEATDNAYLKSNIITITPKVSGNVIQLLVNDNQEVKKNQLLFSIDTEDYLAKQLQAEAGVLEQLAHIQRLLALKTSQHASIDTASASIVAVQAKREQIQQDLQRYQNLIARGSIAQQSLDKIQSESKQAAAELRGSKSAQSAQYQQLLAFDSEISEAQARLKSAQAHLDLAKLDVKNTQIRAPVEGVIGNRGLQQGQLVHPGMVLASLVATQQIWVEANFKETQLAFMRAGQPVSIEVDAYPDVHLTGKVESFSPASGSEFSLLPPENATGNFTKIVRRVPVKIVLDKGSNTGLLKSGLSVAVKVKVK